MANPKPSTTATPGPHTICIHFGINAKQAHFTGYSRAVLSSIMTAAGVHSLLITSTYRDAHDQARAMVHNIQQKGPRHQKALYRGKPGSRLVDLYEREKAAVADAERRGIDTGAKSGFAMQRHLIGVLERRIDEIGPEKVSRHAGLQAILNVFDVDPHSLVPNNLKEFLKAAEHDSRVTRIIPPPKDPAFHFEIAQLGDFPVNTSTAIA